ncbi:Fimbrial protein precursor [Prochlorococcus marinus str. MIT 1313]|uniref:type IV pilin protein n=1 Tax=Prochlorococcus TaxID=1218 RepID=UPI0007B3EBF4|nr:type II secretion system protein [Prochlorococcus marinus]KZR70036.1 Fimbrial protein precursor [Prochlorococcus marinus str. MIT 1313]KZR72760.1 Fimbrial protein precursor [Prochlorococcus marinus str. MIT 1318]
MSIINQRLKLALLSRQKRASALQQGFTLVELMIVIVIVGILSAVALPNFLNQTSKAKATECMAKGGTIMGLVMADALTSKAAGKATLDALVEDANTNSTLCDFTAGDLPGDGSNVFKLTATGKGDLKDGDTSKFDGAWCVDFATGKKEQETTNNGTAPNPGPDCA